MFNFRNKNKKRIKYRKTKVYRMKTSSIISAIVIGEIDLKFSC